MLKNFVIMHGNKKNPSAKRQLLLYTVSDIVDQLGCLNKFLANESPGFSEEGSRIIHSWTAAQTFVDQEIVSNTNLYVALRVVEDYVREQTATPEARETFRRDIRKANIGTRPSTTVQPGLLYYGVAFLREQVEKTLTLQEKKEAKLAQR